MAPCAAWSPSPAQELNPVQVVLAGDILTTNPIRHIGMDTPQTKTDLLDSDNEARIVSDLAARSTSSFLQSLGLVSESYLAQVLIALWDSGMYEYVRLHECVEVGPAAAELRLDQTVLQWLVEYLVGARAHDAQRRRVRPQRVGSLVLELPDAAF